MVQSFKLSEYIIVHGAKLSLVTQLMGYTMLSFIPIILPTALLFAILLTYGRMSQDSEIVAFRALGLDLKHISVPAFLLSFIVAGLSAQVSFNLGPWGNRQLDQLVHTLASTRPTAPIKEGVFSEGFFDLVIYTNEINRQTGVMQRVFIFDERDPDQPLTIVASKGQVVSQSDEQYARAFLRLSEGNMHRSSDEFYTKIDFSKYDISLLDQHTIAERRVRQDAMTLDELRSEIRRGDLEEGYRIRYMLEIQRRWATSASCIIFAIIGVGLGAVTNRRSAKSSGFVLCISVVVVYWLLYATMEGYAKGGNINPFVAAWFTNVVFLAFGIYKMYKVARV